MNGLALGVLMGVCFFFGYGGDNVLHGGRPFYSFASSTTVFAFILGLYFFDCNFSHISTFGVCIWTLALRHIEGFGDVVTRWWVGLCLYSSYRLDINELLGISTSPW